MKNSTNNNDNSFATSMGRRRFIKASLAASGGLMINFSWLSSVAATGDSNTAKTIELNAYIHIKPDGNIIAMVPNPEFGQNLRTSMPMVLAEELDADWQTIEPKQAPFEPEQYNRQFSGGSQSIRRGWQSLRLAGAGAKTLLIMAASAKWQVPTSEIQTKSGVLSHPQSNRSASYGEMASDAARMTLPENVRLKNPNDFSIIGQSKANLDGNNIVTGKPMFGVDYHVDNMLIAGIIHAPAFGQTLEKVDLSEIKKMPGIVDAFVFDSLEEDYTKNYFDSTAFPKLIAIVGKNTWQVLKAKKAVNAKWKNIDAYSEKINRFGKIIDFKVPAGLENSQVHRKEMEALLKTDLPELRKDGDPDKVFKQASKVLERTYYVPHLAHNTMEPMNFFANVTDEEVHVAGPLQAPAFIIGTVAERLNVPKEKVRIEMTRMGGGFGRRAYSHYLVEAAAISQRIKRPVKLMYTREDDMTMGIYRPSYMVRIKAGLDSKNKLIAYQVDGVGVPEHSVAANRFPAGSVPNYLARGAIIDSNITTGAFRAPRSNFMAAAEQSFLDEVSELAETDPIEFRLALFEKAKRSPVGEKNDYDPERYAGVLRLVREKSNWDSIPASIKKGVAAYFCHNSYAAQVITINEKNNTPQVDQVYSALDCGIVVNPDSAINMVEGAVVDGIGNAMYGEMTFTNGQADKTNFDRYRMIRINEVPNAVSVSFVESNIDPTGLGEPPFPPVFSALANALYQYSGKRLYDQPFIKQLDKRAAG